MLHCVSSGRTAICRHACTLWQSLLPPKVRQLFSPCSLCSLGCPFILHTLPLAPQCKTSYTCLRWVALIQTDVQTDRPHICTHSRMQKNIRVLQCVTHLKYLPMCMKGLLTLSTCSATRLLLTFCNVHVTAEYCMTLLIPSALTLHVKSVQLTAAHPVFLLNPNQEVYSGKFEKYNYGSSEANRKHYNQVCDGRGGEGRGEERRACYNYWTLSVLMD